MAAHVYRRFRAPADVRENVLYRRWLLKRADAEPAVRAALLAACADDPVFWIDSFVWQYNPNAHGSASQLQGPFVTWDFQVNVVKEVFDAIAHRTDLLIEKSREMGASWLVELCFLHKCLFRPVQKFLVISRNKEAVDRAEDPDCLFWKIDYALGLMPLWMTGRVKRRVLGISFRKTGSKIFGQATTAKAGVGGRATAMLIDEFSQIEMGHEVLARTADTTGCRIFSGTHVGAATAFAKLATPPSATRKVVVHWSQHPDKRRGLYRYNPATARVDVLDKDFAYPPDFKFVTTGEPTGGPYPGLRSPWYDKRVAKSPSRREVAMDLDIDIKGSASQFFDPLTIARLREYARDPVWAGELAYDRSRGTPLSLIDGGNGRLRLWVNPARGRIPRSRYTMGGDISEGNGATPSCLTVFDPGTREKVAEYADAHLSPQDLAPLASALGWLFCDEAGNPARFAWEMHGPGLKFGQRVVGLNYPNIYYRIDVFKERVQRSDRPGWYPTNDTKLLLLQDYRHALHDGLFVNPSDLALAECLNFQYSPDGMRVINSFEEAVDDPSGARINHADRVIADALAWMMGKDDPTAEEIRVETLTQHPGSLGGRRALAARSASGGWRDAWK